MSNTFETNRLLVKNTRAICKLNAAIAGDVPSNTTYSGTDNDTLNSGATASLTLNHIEGESIRIVNVTSSDTANLVTIAITQADANVINHAMYGGSYNLELAMDQSPITSVVVTATTANDTNVVINTLSKTI